MTGHFASVCKTNQEQKKKNKRKQDRRGKVNCVEDGEDDDYAFAVGSGDSCHRFTSGRCDTQCSSHRLRIIVQYYWPAYMGTIEAERRKVQIREDKSEIVSLWNFRTTEHSGKVWGVGKLCLKGSYSRIYCNWQWRHTNYGQENSHGIECT